MNEFQLPMLNRDRAIQKIADCLRGLTTKKAHRIIIKQELDDRTVQQCRYLNGVAYKLLGDFTGYERDAISDHMCRLYFGEVEVRVPRSKNNPKGLEDRPLRTTTTDEHGERDVLSTKDFWEYVEFIQRFGAQHGVYIPDPDPSYKHLQREPEPQVQAA